MARIALLIGEGFEESELHVPRARLQEHGHEVEYLGREAGRVVRGKRGVEHARIDRAAEGAQVDEYDALVIPGGRSPEDLRGDGSVIAFVRAWMRAGKPLAAICHGPLILADADVVRGKRITSSPWIRAQLEQAGATWVDQPVVVEGALITSRDPDDLEVFAAALLARLGSATIQPARTPGGTP